MIRKLLFCVAACAVLLCGCEEKIDAPDSLEGTTWESSFNDDGARVAVVLTFTKDTFKYVLSLMDVEDGGGFTETTQGKYTYSRPNVVLAEEFEGGVDYLQGVVDGNQLVFQEDDEDSVVFRKKM